MLNAGMIRTENSILEKGKTLVLISNVKGRN